jgi:putative ABC transport system permease protein
VAPRARRGSNLEIRSQRRIPWVISALLFGISPTDPWTFASVVLAHVIVGAVALYVPARRASRLKPATELRTE